MSKITILSFIDWYRPGYKAGGTVTSFGNFVDYLEPYFNFKIVTRDTDFLGEAVYSTINSDVWNTPGETECYYLSNSNISYGKIKKMILDTPHDIIYINGVFSLYFSILPLLFSRQGKCIMNPHGMLSDQAFSVKSIKKKFFLMLANILGLFKHVVFHVSNEDEAKAVQKRIKRFKSIKIANQFPRKLEHDFYPKAFKQNPVRFINVARISIEKGTLKMLDALRDLIQPLVLDIYGPIYDKAYWVKCQETIAQLPAHIKVIYKGILPSEQIPETLSKYDYFVLLSEGENFGHAIIEALSVGLPVIISNKTPWTALSEKSVGWDVNNTNYVDIKSSFNAALTMSDTTYKHWSKSAHSYAKTFIENPELLQQNKDLFLNQINNK